MNPIEDIKNRLEKYPKVTFEEKDNYICTLPASESGFDVWFTENERDYAVGFSTWHKHFDKDKLEEALNFFSWGLSESCRLKVYSRNNKQYKWQVQSLDNDNWVPFSTTTHFNLFFWKQAEVTYKSNKLISA